jgi:hypothetical protein
LEITVFVNLRALVFASLVAMLLPGCAGPVSPKTLDASQEKAVKSLSSDTKAQITFVNKSGQRINVYWLDFSGHRVLYKMLEAGESYDQQTFLTHPWLVTDSGDNAWNIFLAGTQPTVVEIVAPVQR